MASSATKGVCVRALIRPMIPGRWRSWLIDSATRDPARMEAFDAEIIEKIAPATITMPPIGPRKARAATPMAASVYSVRSATTTTSTTMEYSTVTTIIEMKMARGMVFVGLITSPAEAAMAENPKKVMKTRADVDAISWMSVLKRSVSTAASRLPIPPAMNHISSTILVAVTTTWKVPLSLVPFMLRSVSAARKMMPGSAEIAKCQMNSLK